jgi:hypothetical protein
VKLQAFLQALPGKQCELRHAGRPRITTPVNATVLVVIAIRLEADRRSRVALGRVYLQAMRNELVAPPLGRIGPLENVDAPARGEETDRSVDDVDREAEVHEVRAERQDIGSPALLMENS